MSVTNLLIYDSQLIEERDYWLERLTDENGNARLVPEQKRGEGSESGRAELEVEIGADLLRKLERLSGESEFLLYAVLVAGLKVCMQRYGVGGRVAIGSPALREGERENAVVLIDEIEAGESFRGLLLRVRETLLEAYKRQRYPIGRLMRELGREEEGERCGLFDVALGLEGLHGAMPEVGEDLRTWLGRARGVLSGRIRYKGGLYSAGWVERFWRHYRRLLEGGVDETEEAIEKLEMLLPEERERLLRERNRTEVAYEGRGVHELFEEQVSRRPWAVAVRREEEQLSYAELNKRANQVASRLRSRGVGVEQVVGLCLKRSVEMIVGLLGILKSGAAYLPLDPDHPEERLGVMIREGGVKVVLTGEQYEEKGGGEGEESRG